MQAEEILNKQSGWRALTGTTDFGAISSSSDHKSRLAIDIFVDRILGFVGSYYVKLGGKVDALVFAGGIGEKAASLRAKVVEACACLGFELDKTKNQGAIDGTVQDIGKDGSRHRTLVCQTDEQVRLYMFLMVFSTKAITVRDGSTVCPWACKPNNIVTQHEEHSRYDIRITLINGQALHMPSM